MTDMDNDSTLGDTVLLDGELSKNSARIGYWVFYFQTMTDMDDDYMREELSCIKDFYCPYVI